MRTSRLQWNKKTIILCMLPPIILYFALHLFPSTLTGLISLTNMPRVGNNWEFVGLRNYKELFLVTNKRDTLAALKRTVVFALSVTLIKDSLAILVAVLFNDKAVRGRNIYRAITFLPTILGTTICCYAWVLFMSLDGPLMPFLKSIGIKTGLLGSQKDAFKCVILIQIWISLGYSMVIDIAGLQSIPQELYEAAAIDGASPIQRFFNVTIPQLWPTITVNVLISIIGALSIVQTILLTTGGNNNTSTLAMNMYWIAFGVGGMGSAPSNSLGYASAMAMVLFVIVLIFTLGVLFLMKKRGDSYEN